MVLVVIKSKNITPLLRLVNQITKNNTSPKYTTKGKKYIHITKLDLRKAYSIAKLIKLKHPTVKVKILYP